MNIDDPKLTAFALDELDEPEKSTVAREIAQSLEAQRAVDETREMARLLRSQFAVELNEKTKPPLSLTDIRDDPWFWSIGRPLAVAAVVAMVALLGAVLIGTYSRQESPRSVAPDYVIQAEQNSPNEHVNLPAVDTIPNPVPPGSIQQIDRVVIGEISEDSREENEQLRPIETIRDRSRIARLKERLSVPVVSRMSSYRVPDRCYGLVFLDPSGRIVASARFCRAADSEFVLQPVKNGYEREGRYFIGGNTSLPGEWRSGIDYSQYGIQFPDWLEAIGYAPGA